MAKTSLGKVTIQSDEPKLEAPLGAERYDIKASKSPGEKVTYRRPDEKSKNNLSNSPDGCGERTASSPDDSSVGRPEMSRPDLHNMDGSIA